LEWSILLSLWCINLDCGFFFGDGNWRQAEACIVLLAGAFEVNALAQGALRQFTQWLWIEHPTFQLGGGNLTTELLPPQWLASQHFGLVGNLSCHEALTEKEPFKVLFFLHSHIFCTATWAWPFLHSCKCYWLRSEHLQDGVDGHSAKKLSFFRRAGLISIPPK